MKTSELIIALDFGTFPAIFSINLEKKKILQRNDSREKISCKQGNIHPSKVSNGPSLN